LRIEQGLELAVIVGDARVRRFGLHRLHLFRPAETKQSGADQKQERDQNNELAHFSPSRAVGQRATLLIEQLLSGGAADANHKVDELAATALRTWSLPELAPYRAGLIAEVPVYGRLPGDGERLVAGRAETSR
jgi:hypothetical protein